MARHAAVARRRPHECHASGLIHVKASCARGLDPQNWRPVRAIGPGVREIRVRDGSGAFRVIHLAAADDAAYVLHAFQRKTQQTARSDIQLAARAGLTVEIRIADPAG
jgi:phage-related protein